MSGPGDLSNTTTQHFISATTDYTGAYTHTHTHIRKTTSSNRPTKYAPYYSVIHKV